MLKISSTILFVPFLLGIMLSCDSAIQSKEQKTQSSNLDSISIWIEHSKSPQLSDEKRKYYLRKAHQWSGKLKNDSIKKQNLLGLLRSAHYLQGSHDFTTIIKEANKISIQHKDTLGMAIVNHYYGLHYWQYEKMDSAFYFFSKANKFYHLLNDAMMMGHTAYGMALVQNEVHDHTGGEISTFEAIGHYKEMEYTSGLHNCYNILGTSYNKLEEYDKALLYLNKAQELIPFLEDQKSEYATNYNNIGLVYQKKGEYLKSIEYFKRVLNSKNFMKKDIEHYARVLSNLNHSRLLVGDTVQVYPNLLKSLQIRDSIGDLSNIISSNLHLVEYFLVKKDTVTAIKHAKKANHLAISIKENRNYLNSLKILSNLDKVNGQVYFDKYVSLDDSLQKHERQLRNKFTRIRFETDEFIEQTEELTHEKNQIATVAAVIIFILGLLYIIKVQRSRNKKLAYEQEQQMANENIYNLMLREQSTIDGTRNRERQRIAKELHDGIIGKIFATRLTFSFLDFNGMKENKEKYRGLIKDLQEVEKDIRDVSHELNQEFEKGQNFSSIVTELVQQQSSISPIEYQLYIDEKINWSLLAGNVKMNLYRVLQESFQNIHKYSKAKKVEIKFVNKDNSIECTIHDDGQGFDLKRSSKGIGIKNMQSRIGSIEGAFSIESNKSEGTKVKVQVSYSG